MGIEKEFVHMNRATKNAESTARESLKNKIQATLARMSAIKEEKRELYVGQNECHQRRETGTLCRRG